MSLEVRGVDPIRAPQHSTSSHNVGINGFVQRISPANLCRMMVNGYSIEAGADLAGADLSHADLTEAYLKDANLTGANLTNTIQSGTILNGATMPDGSVNN